MAAPTLESFAARLYAAMEPVAGDDELNSYALAAYLATIGSMVQEIADYAETGPDGQVGWSPMVDLDRIPDKGLGYLAQFLGVRLNPLLDADGNRARIRATDGWNRGTVAAIVGAARQHLTGAQTVIIRERDPAVTPADPAYGFSVITRDDETPDPDIVEAALLAQKPAGLIMSYRHISGQDYQSLFEDFDTYQDVYETYATYEGVVEDEPGT